MRRFNLSFMFVTSCMLTLFVSSGTIHALEARAFGLGYQIKSDEMNDSLEAQSLKRFRDIPGFGAEVSVESVARIHWGLRFSVSHLHLGDGTGQTLSADPFFSEITAKQYQAVFRWTLIDGAPLRFDLFGGAGGVHAVIKTRTATGEFEQGIRQDDMRFMQSAGASIHFGTKNFYFFIEGGHQWAPVARLKHDIGTPNPINMIDLTGPWIAAGFLFRNWKGK